MLGGDHFGVHLHLIHPYQKRFLKIYQHIKFYYKGKISIFDFGCGLSDLFLFLKKKKLKFSYEGIDTSKSIFKLKNIQNVNMPISEQVYKILFNNKNPNNAISELMTRPLVNENRS